MKILRPGRPSSMGPCGTNLVAMNLTGIEVIEDRTSVSRCDEGFLRLRRLVVQNVYDDGTTSRAYPCDLVRRKGSDAVVAVLHEVDEEGRVWVLLREAPRVPVYLRREEEFVHPDPREYLTVIEVVAGIVEADDPSGVEGLRRRAAAEAREEAGIEADPGIFEELGGETFASPGTSDEKIYFVSGEVALEAGHASGDGSAMEEWGRLHRLELREAITMCRDGRIPDMKNEVALLRLADVLLYLHSIDTFVRELPEQMRRRHRPEGLGRSSEGTA